jgi:hypothetical protein
MNIDGVWKVEIQGPYNKEAFSTVFLKNGRYFGGSVSHYSIGRYKEDGGVFKAKVVITQHGGLRTMFGDKKKRVKVRMEGKLRKKGGKLSIRGTARASTGKGIGVRLTLTRLGALD